MKGMKIIKVSDTCSTTIRDQLESQSSRMTAAQAEALGYINRWSFYKRISRWLDTNH